MDPEENFVQGAPITRWRERASLLTIVLLERQLRGRSLEKATDADLEAVRERCVFTTHTPVPAGHDRFSMEQAHRILGSERIKLIERVGGCHGGLLNMTYIALRFARYVNGVAMQMAKCRGTVPAGKALSKLAVLERTLASLDAATGLPWRRQISTHRMTITSSPARP
jgi:hypothetical protein